jgi:hypothetical protein
MLILMLIAASCASNKPGYHPHKTKRPKNCNCSDWGYNYNLKTDKQLTIDYRPPTND